MIKSGIISMGQGPRGMASAFRNRLKKTDSGNVSDGLPLLISSESSLIPSSPGPPRGSGTYTKKEGRRPANAGVGLGVLQSDCSKKRHST